MLLIPLTLCALAYAQEPVNPSDRLLAPGRESSTFVHPNCTVPSPDQATDLRGIAFEYLPRFGAVPYAMFAQYSFVYGGRLVFLGGLTDTTTPHMSPISEFSLCDRTWRTISTRGNPPPARSFACVAQHGLSVYLYGGWEEHDDEVVRFDDLWAFSLADYSWRSVVTTNDVRPVFSQFPICVTSSNGFFYIPTPSAESTMLTASGSRVARQDVYQFRVRASLWEITFEDAHADGVELPSWPVRWPQGSAVCDSGGQLVYFLFGHGQFNFPEVVKTEGGRGAEAAAVGAASSARSAAIAEAEAVRASVSALGKTGAEGVPANARGEGGRGSGEIVDSVKAAAVAQHIRRSRHASRNSKRPTVLRPRRGVQSGGWATLSADGIVDLDPRIHAKTSRRAHAPALVVAEQSGLSKDAVRAREMVVKKVKRLAGVGVSSSTRVAITRGEPLRTLASSDSGAYVVEDEERSRMRWSVCLRAAHRTVSPPTDRSDRYITTANASDAVITAAATACARSVRVEALEPRASAAVRSALSVIEHYTDVVEDESAPSGGAGASPRNAASSFPPTSGARPPTFATAALLTHPPPVIRLADGAAREHYTTLRAIAERSRAYEARLLHTSLQPLGGVMNSSAHPPKGDSQAPGATSEASADGRGVSHSSHSEVLGTRDTVSVGADDVRGAFADSEGSLSGRRRSITSLETALVKVGGTTLLDALPHWFVGWMVDVWVAFSASWKEVVVVTVILLCIAALACRARPQPLKLPAGWAVLLFFVVGSDAWDCFITVPKRSIQTPPTDGSFVPVDGTISWSGLEFIVTDHQANLFYVAKRTMTGSSYTFSGSPNNYECGAQPTVWMSHTYHGQKFKCVLDSETSSTGHFEFEGLGTGVPVRSDTGNYPFVCVSGSEYPEWQFTEPVTAPDCPWLATTAYRLLTIDGINEVEAQLRDASASFNSGLLKTDASGLLLAPDHAKGCTFAGKCIDAGFNSYMMDDAASPKVPLYAISPSPVSGHFRAEYSRYPGDSTFATQNDTAAQLAWPKCATFCDSALPDYTGDLFNRAASSGQLLDPICTNSAGFYTVDSAPAVQKLFIAEGEQCTLPKANTCATDFSLFNTAPAIADAVVVCDSANAGRFSSPSSNWNSAELPFTCTLACDALNYDLPADTTLTSPYQACSQLGAYDLVSNNFKNLLQCTPAACSATGGAALVKSGNFLEPSSTKVVCYAGATTATPQLWTSTGSGTKVSLLDSVVCRSLLTLLWPTDGVAPTSTTYGSVQPWYWDNTAKTLLIDATTTETAMPLPECTAGRPAYRYNAYSVALQTVGTTVTISYKYDLNKVATDTGVTTVPWYSCASRCGVYLDANLATAPGDANSVYTICGSSGLIVLENGHKVVYVEFTTASCSPTCASGYQLVWAKGTASSMTCSSSTLLYDGASSSVGEQNVPYRCVAETALLAVAEDPSAVYTCSSSITDSLGAPLLLGPVETEAFAGAVNSIYASSFGVKDVGGNFLLDHLSICTLTWGCAGTTKNAVKAVIGTDTQAYWGVDVVAAVADAAGTADVLQLRWATLNQIVDSATLACDSYCTYTVPVTLDISLASTFPTGLVGAATLTACGHGGTFRDGTTLYVSADVDYGTCLLTSFSSSCVQSRSLLLGVTDQAKTSMTCVFDSTASEYRLQLDDATALTPVPESPASGVGIFGCSYSCAPVKFVPPIAMGSSSADLCTTLYSEPLAATGVGPWESGCTVPITACTGGQGIIFTYTGGQPERAAVGFECTPNDIDNPTAGELQLRKSDGMFLGTAGDTFCRTFAKVPWPDTAVVPDYSTPTQVQLMQTVGRYWWFDQTENALFFDSLRGPNYPYQPGNYTCTTTDALFRYLHDAFTATVDQTTDGETYVTLTRNTGTVLGDDGVTPRRFGEYFDCVTPCRIFIDRNTDNSPSDMTTTVAYWCGMSGQQKVEGDESPFYALYASDQVCVPPCRSSHTLVWSDPDIDAMVCTKYGRWRARRKSTGLELQERTTAAKNIPYRCVQNDLLVEVEKARDTGCTGIEPTGSSALTTTSVYFMDVAEQGVLTSSTGVFANSFGVADLSPFYSCTLDASSCSGTDVYPTAAVGATGAATAYANLRKIERAANADQVVLTWAEFVGGAEMSYVVPSGTAVSAECTTFCRSGIPQHLKSAVTSVNHAIVPASLCGHRGMFVHGSGSADSILMAAGLDFGTCSLSSSVCEAAAPNMYISHPTSQASQVLKCSSTSGTFLAGTDNKAVSSTLAFACAARCADFTYDGTLTSAGCSFAVRDHLGTDFAGSWDVCVPGSCTETVSLYSDSGSLERTATKLVCELDTGAATSFLYTDSDSYVAKFGKGTCRTFGSVSYPAGAEWDVTKVTTDWQGALGGVGGVFYIDEPTRTVFFDTGSTTEVPLPTFACLGEFEPSFVADSTATHAKAKLVGGENRVLLFDNTDTLVKTLGLHEAVFTCAACFVYVAPHTVTDPPTKVHAANALYCKTGVTGTLSQEGDHWLIGFDPTVATVCEPVCEDGYVLVWSKPSMKNVVCTGDELFAADGSTPVDSTPRTYAAQNIPYQCIPDGDLVEVPGLQGDCVGNVPPPVGSLAGSSWLLRVSNTLVKTGVFLNAFSGSLSHLSECTISSTPAQCSSGTQKYVLDTDDGPFINLIKVARASTSDDFVVSYAQFVGSTVRTLSVSNQAEFQCKELCVMPLTSTEVHPSSYAVSRTFCGSPALFYDATTNSERLLMVPGYSRDPCILADNVCASGYRLFVGATSQAKRTLSCSVTGGQFQIGTSAVTAGPPYACARVCDDVVYRGLVAADRTSEECLYGPAEDFPTDFIGTKVECVPTVCRDGAKFVTSGILQWTGVKTKCVAGTGGGVETHVMDSTDASVGLLTESICRTFAEAIFPVESKKPNADAAEEALWDAVGYWYYDDAARKLYIDANTSRVKYLPTPECTNGPVLWASLSYSKAVVGTSLSGVNQISLATASDVISPATYKEYFDCPCVCELPSLSGSDVIGCGPSTTVLEKDSKKYIISPSTVTFSSPPTIDGQCDVAKCSDCCGTLGERMALFGGEDLYSTTSFVCSAGTQSACTADPPVLEFAYAASKVPATCSGASPCADCGSKCTLKKTGDSLESVCGHPWRLDGQVYTFFLPSAVAECMPSCTAPRVARLSGASADVFRCNVNGEVAQIMDAFNSEVQKGGNVACALRCRAVDGTNTADFYFDSVESDTTIMSRQATCSTGSRPLFADAITAAVAVCTSTGIDLRLADADETVLHSYTSFELTHTTEYTCTPYCSLEMPMRGPVGSCTGTNAWALEADLSITVFQGHSCPFTCPAGYSASVSEFSCPNTLVKDGIPQPFASPSQPYACYYECNIGAPSVIDFFSQVAIRCKTGPVKSSVSGGVLTYSGFDAQCDPVCATHYELADSKLFYCVGPATMVLDGKLENDGQEGLYKCQPKKCRMTWPASVPTASRGCEVPEEHTVTASELIYYHSGCQPTCGSLHRAFLIRSSTVEVEVDNDNKLICLDGAPGAVINGFSSVETVNFACRKTCTFGSISIIHSRSENLAACGAGQTLVLKGVLGDVAVYDQKSPTLRCKDGTVFADIPVNGGVAAKFDVELKDPLFQCVADCSFKVSRVVIDVTDSNAGESPDVATVMIYPGRSWRPTCDATALRRSRLVPTSLPQFSCSLAGVSTPSNFLSVSSTANVHAECYDSCIFDQQSFSKQTGPNVHWQGSKHYLWDSDTGAVECDSYHTFQAGSAFKGFSSGVSYKLPLYTTLTCADGVLTPTTSSTALTAASAYKCLRPCYSVVDVYASSTSPFTELNGGFVVSNVFATRHGLLQSPTCSVIPRTIPAVGWSVSDGRFQDFFPLFWCDDGKALPVALPTDDPSAATPIDVTALDSRPYKCLEACAVAKKRSGSLDAPWLQVDLRYELAHGATAEVTCDKYYTPSVGVDGDMKPQLTNLYLTCRDGKLFNAATTPSLSRPAYVDWAGFDTSRPADLSEAYYCVPNCMLYFDANVASVACESDTWGKAVVQSQPFLHIPHTESCRVTCAANHVLEVFGGTGLHDELFCFEGVAFLDDLFTMPADSGLPYTCHEPCILVRDKNEAENSPQALTPMSDLVMTTIPSVPRPGATRLLQHDQREQISCVRFFTTEVNREVRADEYQCVSSKAHVRAVNDAGLEELVAVQASPPFECVPDCLIPWDAQTTPAAGVTLADGVNVCSNFADDGVEGFYALQSTDNSGQRKFLHIPHGYSCLPRCLPDHVLMVNDYEGDLASEITCDRGIPQEINFPIKSATVYACLSPCSLPYSVGVKSFSQGDQRTIDGKKVQLVEHHVDGAAPVAFECEEFHVAETGASTKDVSVLDSNQLYCSDGVLLNDGKRQLSSPEFACRRPCRIEVDVGLSTAAPCVGNAQGQVVSTAGTDEFILRHSRSCVVSCLAGYTPEVGGRLGDSRLVCDESVWTDGSLILTTPVYRCVDPCFIGLTNLNRFVVWADGVESPTSSALKLSVPGAPGARLQTAFSIYPVCRQYHTLQILDYPTLDPPSVATSTLTCTDGVWHSSLTTNPVGTAPYIDIHDAPYRCWSDCFLDLDEEWLGCEVDTTEIVTISVGGEQVKKRWLKHGRSCRPQCGGAVGPYDTLEWNSGFSDRFFCFHGRFYDKLPVTDVDPGTGPSTNPFLCRTRSRTVSPTNTPTPTPTVACYHSCRIASPPVCDTAAPCCTLVTNSGRIQSGLPGEGHGIPAMCSYLIAPTDPACGTIELTMKYEIDRDNDAPPALACANAGMEIFDGPDSRAPKLRRRFCGAPEGEVVIQASTAEVFIELRANNLAQDGSFDISYRCVQGEVSTCRSTTFLPIYRESGFLTDGEGLYFPNQLCVWQVFPPAQVAQTCQAFDIYFLAFDLERTVGCERDLVAVFEGTVDITARNDDYSLNTAAVPAHTFCGSSLPSRFRTKDASFTAAFATDPSINSAGFRLAYQCVCEACATTVPCRFTQSSGQVVTPSGYTAPAVDSDCRWELALSASSCASIAIVVQRLSLEPGDTLYIYADTDVAVHTLTSSLPEPQVFSVPNSVAGLTLDRTNGGSSSVDFDWLCQCDSCPSACSHVLTRQAPGQIDFPSNGGKYDPLDSCQWTVVTYECENIILNFNHMSVEFDVACDYDAITVYDGPTPESPILAKLCGTALPSSLRSSTSTVLIQFSSDKDVELNGFSISYSCPCYCETQGCLLTASQSSITNGPGPYSNNEVCEWTVSPNDKDGCKLLVVELVKLDIEPPSLSRQGREVCGDKLLVYDGPDDKATLLTDVELCGKDEAQPLFISRSSDLFVRFSTDSNLVAEGFELRYNCVASPECYSTCTQGCLVSVEKNDDKGVIEYFSDAGYGATETCTYSVVNTFYPFCNELLIVADRMDTELSAGCVYDYILIYDGRNRSTPLLARWCGTPADVVPITTTGPAVSIVFASDATKHGKGFRLKWSCLEKSRCDTTCPPPSLACIQSGTAGRVTNGAMDYENGQTCEWRIHPSTDPAECASIVIVFADIPDLGAGDCLMVYEVSGPDPELAWEMCICETCDTVSEVPYLQLAGDGKYSVQLRADNVGNGAGFDLTWKCLGQEDCSDGIDNNDDGLVDCADALCELAPSCRPPVTASDALAPVDLLINSLPTADSLSDGFYFWQKGSTRLRRISPKDPLNGPPKRRFGVCFPMEQGLFLAGGQGPGCSGPGNVPGVCNDLWWFSFSTQQWFLVTNKMPLQVQGTDYASQLWGTLSTRYSTWNNTIYFAHRNGVYSISLDGVELWDASNLSSSPEPAPPTYTPTPTPLTPFWEDPDPEKPAAKAKPKRRTAAVQAVSGGVAVGDMNVDPLSPVAVGAGHVTWSGTLSGLGGSDPRNALAGVEGDGQADGQNNTSDLLPSVRQGLLLGRHSNRSLEQLGGIQFSSGTAGVPLPRRAYDSFQTGVGAAFAGSGLVHALAALRPDVLQLGRSLADTFALIPPRPATLAVQRVGEQLPASENVSDASVHTGFNSSSAAVASAGVLGGARSFASAAAPDANTTSVTELVSQEPVSQGWGEEEAETSYSAQSLADVSIVGAALGASVRVRESPDADVAGPLSRTPTKVQSGAMGVVTSIPPLTARVSVSEADDVAAAVVDKMRATQKAARGVVGADATWDLYRFDLDQSDRLDLENAAGRLADALQITDIVSATSIRELVPPLDSGLVPLLRAFAIASVGDYVYAFGGLGLSSQLRQGMPLGNLWRVRLGEMMNVDGGAGNASYLAFEQALVPGVTPAARAFHCMHARHAYLVVFGGHADVYETQTRNELYFNDLWFYNSIDNQWEEVEVEMGPSPRAEAGSVVTDGYLFVYGGRDETFSLRQRRNLTNALWRFSFELRFWEALDLPVGLSTAGQLKSPVFEVVRVGSELQLVIMGGRSDGYPSDVGIWVCTNIEAAALNWTTANCEQYVAADDVARSVYQVTAAGVGPRVFIFGGGDDGRRLLMYDVRAPNEIEVLNQGLAEYPAGYPEPARLSTPTMVQYRRSLLMMGGVVWEDGSAFSPTTYFVQRLSLLRMPPCGDFGNGPVGEVCMPCALGSHGPECEPCEPGTYGFYEDEAPGTQFMAPRCVTPMAPVAPQGLPNGTTTVQARQSAGTTDTPGYCRSGFFSPFTHAAGYGLCQPCPAGTFQSDPGATSCSPCEDPSLCPPGSIAPGVKTDSGVVTDAISLQPTEHTQEVKSYLDAQTALRWPLVGFLLFMLLILIPVRFSRPWYLRVAQCDLFGRGYSTFLGGWWTIVFVTSFLLLSIIQMWPTLTGEEVMSASLRPIVVQTDTASGLMTITHIVNGYYDSCSARLVDYYPCSPGPSPNISGSEISVCFQNLPAANATVVSQTVRERGICIVNITLPEFFVTDRGAATTKAKIDTWFNGRLSAATSLNSTVLVDAGWPDQTSGYVVPIASSTKDQFLRGSVPSVLQFQATPVYWAAVANDTSRTGYYLRLDNVSSGSQTRPSDFYRTVGLGIVAEFQIQQTWYSVDINPVVSPGLAILLLLSLFGALYDAFLWIVIACDAVIIHAFARIAVRYRLRHGREVPPHITWAHIALLIGDRSYKRDAGLYGGTYDTLDHRPRYKRAWDCVCAFFNRLFPGEKGMANAGLYGNQRDLLGAPAAAGSWSWIPWSKARREEKAQIAATKDVATLPPKDWMVHMDLPTDHRGVAPGVRGAVPLSKTDNHPLPSMRTDASFHASVAAAMPGMDFVFPSSRDSHHHHDHGGEAQRKPDAVRDFFDALSPLGAQQVQDTPGDGPARAMHPSVFEQEYAPPNELEEEARPRQAQQLNAGNLESLARSPQFQSLSAVVALCLFEKGIIRTPDADMDDFGFGMSGYTSSSDMGVSGVHKRMMRRRLRIRPQNGQPAHFVENPLYISWRKKYKWLLRDQSVKLVVVVVAGGGASVFVSFAFLGVLSIVLSHFRTRESCCVQFVFLTLGLCAVGSFLWAYTTQRIFDG